MPRHLAWHFVVAMASPSAPTPLPTSERPSLSGWRPRAYFWDGGFLGIGKPGAGRVPPHAHHAFQVTFSLEEPVALSEGDEQWREIRGAVVMADQTHEFDPRGQLVAMIFVDPESREGTWLRRSLRETINPIEPDRLAPALDMLRAFHTRPPDAAGTADMVNRIVRGLCAGPPPVRKLDDRIVRALAIIREMEAPRIRLEEVAEAVFLSPGRFQHLFSEEVGLPFRRYVLWRKLARALVEIGRGNSLSAAAHGAGFSDSAHLTRTFYQMFGIPPTLMLSGGEFWEIPAPFEVADRSMTPPGA